MAIDSRCKEQQEIAKQLFMMFVKHQPGSSEQCQAIIMFNFLMSMWADFFLVAEVRRMDAANALKKPGW